MREDRIGIPKQHLKDTSGKQDKDYSVYWEKSKGDLKIHSWTVINKSKKAKNVNLLATYDAPFSLETLRATHYT